MSEISVLNSKYRGLRNAVNRLSTKLDELNELEELVDQRSEPMLEDAKSLGLIGNEGVLICVQEALSDEWVAKREAILAKSLELLSRGIESRVVSVREALGVEKVDTLQAFIEWVVKASGESTDVEKLKLLGMALGAVKQFSSGVAPADVKLSLGKSESESDAVEELVSGAI